MSLRPGDDLTLIKTNCSTHHISPDNTEPPSSDVLAASGPAETKKKQKNGEITI